jgi:hypothetical protein
VQIIGVKALLQCTDGELECVAEKLLDVYIEEVTRVIEAVLSGLPEANDKGNKA